jgi:N-acetyl-anhydromuramyl-L-alanine amidase AmpD
MLMKANGKAAEEVFLALNEVSAVMFEIVPEPAKPVPVPTVPPAPKPDASKMPAIDITEYDSPNCSTRAATITHIILHNTAGAFKPSIDWLCKSEAQASAHLVISRRGETACIVDFSKAAWHAGSREWNHRSLGIEIEDFDSTPGMPAAQEAKVLEWCRWMMQRYNIKPENIRTHRSVLPGETDCPVLVWKTEADFAAWKAKNLAV